MKIEEILLETSNIGDNFKRWFGKSVIADANGNPLKVFHGTQTKDISIFKTPTWFTPSQRHADGFSAEWSTSGKRSNNSNILEVYLRIENPVHTSDWTVTEPNDDDMLKQFAIWKSKGHDGIIFTSDEGEIEYIIFSPNQVKSATHNNGSYDPNNPNIFL